MLAYCLVNKLLIFVKSYFCYLLYNRYTLSCILLKLKIKNDLKTFVN